MNTTHTGWLTRRQTCDRLAISMTTLDGLLRMGELTGVRLPQMAHIRIPIADVEAYEERGITQHYGPSLVDHTRYPAPAPLDVGHPVRRKPA